MSQQNIDQEANQEDPDNQETGQNDQKKREDLKTKLNLINRDPGFREAFEKAAQNGKVKIENVFDVINDWSIELDMDCEDAKRYFDRDNSPLAPEDLRDSFDFDGFLNVFGRWLEREYYGLEPQVSDQKPYWFKSEDSQPTQKTEAHITTETSEVRDRRSHEQLVKEIFTVHQAETQKMFQEFASLGGDFTSEEPTVARQDFPLLLKNLLYNRDASLYEKDGEDFFMRNNTYSNLDEFLNRVRQEGENEDQPQAPPDRLNFDEFKTAVITFVKEHPDLVIMEHKRAEDKKNKQPPQGSQNLEESLLEQIQTYQTKLQNAQSEVEKQVVRNMITTLVKQLDVLHEAKEEQNSLMNQSVATKKKQQLQISFSGIPRPQKKLLSEDEKDEQRMEKNFTEIFTFFCRQQYINGAQGQSFDRYSVEGQTMSIGMFLYFCECFNLFEPKVKVPFDVNQLEQKRRGIEIPPQKPKVKPVSKPPEQEEEQLEEENEENEEEKVKQPEETKPVEQPKKTIKRIDFSKMVQPPEKIKQSMAQVPSKFQWWQDEQKFNQYYQPKDQASFADRPIDYKYLSRKEIVTLFKKVTFGKDLQINEFKEMLGLIAQKMFFNPENPSERHPNAYMRMIEQIKLNEPNEYKKLLVPHKIPFGCREPDGFREPKHQEGLEYKIHSLNEEQKKSLIAFKQQRDSFIKDRTSNANSTLLSVGSMGNLSINTLNSRNPKSYQDKPKHGKIDFDRQKVSWDRLEHLNFNEVQGVGPQNFKPRDLIDPLEDDEDRYYLREFELSPDERFGVQQVYSAEDQKRSLERYGLIKPQLRPTQKVTHHQQSVSAVAKLHSVEPSQGRYVQQYAPQQGCNKKIIIYLKDNNYSMNLKEQYLQRAQEIQQLQNQRENKIYQHIQQQQKNVKQILRKQARKAH